MEIHWYLIPHDGPYPWNAKGQRLIDFAYLRQIATTVDHLGYDGALLAGGGSAHDLWGLGFSLIPYTERMKFIIAQHPGTLSPMLLAQQAATFDQFSKGRLIINIVNGADTHGLPYGVFLDHDERYAMADEYWGAWRRIMSGETVDFDGQYVKLRNARLALKPVQQPYPELYFGGSSLSAQQVAAKHTDTYLTWGEPPPLAQEKVASVQRLAATQGRQVRFGIRIYLIVRETKEEAWAAAQWLYDHMDKEAIERNRSITRNTDSVGQQRMNAVIGDKLTKNARDLEVYPDIWAGIGLIRVGPGLAIVGDPETVAERIHEYENLGFEVFIVSGYPLIEEAYRVSDLLFPILKPDGWQNRNASNLIDLNAIRRPEKLGATGG